MSKLFILKHFPKFLLSFNSENEVTVNPMVKGFREQLDSDDEQNQQPVM
jgi:hypothetical protein